MATEKSFRLYNTATRRVDALEPLQKGHLRYYACGPTVYTTAHIGNFRSFLTADLIQRTARALGWRCTYVSNITDVGHLTEDDMADASGEDKMSQALRSAEGAHFANIYDLARHYTGLLLEDWRALNLLEPDVRPRA
ncbi:MAG: cysteine--tRNA ligase, partial [Bacteroidota bacterium]